MLSELRPTLFIFIVLTLVTGVVYPGVVTLVGKIFFADATRGSLIERDGHAVGSKFIGQPFSGPRYFWSRPSATAPQPYNGSASSGSNQGPINPTLETAVRDRIAVLKTADPQNRQPIPIDLVTASASGLDPHISPAAAEYQLARVARARELEPARVRAEVQRATEGRTFGVLGEPRVNVLELNLALDALK